MAVYQAMPRRPRALPDTRTLGQALSHVKQRGSCWVFLRAWGAARDGGIHKHRAHVSPPETLSARDTVRPQPRAVRAPHATHSLLSTRCFLHDVARDSLTLDARALLP